MPMWWNNFIYINWICVMKNIDDEEMIKEYQNYEMFQGCYLI